MASHKNNLKIHEHCKIAPPTPTTTTKETSFPLTFFDLFWLRFHPVERVFYYTLQNSQSHPSFFFNTLLPNLKSSLSLTLQHFLPLAGNIIWPPSEVPKVQYTPGDSVSLTIAESNENFNNLLQKNTPHEASISRSFVPHLESTDSFASVISFQITLFPKSGFSIGITSHHGVLDGKSSIMFIKAWASISTSQTKQASQTLAPELEPLFNREFVKDPIGIVAKFTETWNETQSKMFPLEENKERSLKILPFQPKLENNVRSTFDLTREDLDKIKKWVLAKWDTNSKPNFLSSFVVTCAYVLVCVAKAIHGVEKEKEKFGFAFTVDCRSRMDPPYPQNYFGNCVWGGCVDTNPLDYIQEDGVFLVGKSIHEKIKMMGEKGIFEGVDNASEKFKSLLSEKVEIIGIAGSNRFGVYGIDFGWGKPDKVEITSIDRGLTIGLAESRDGSGGVEVGLVLNKDVMDRFSTLFNEGLACVD